MNNLTKILDITRKSVKYSCRQYYWPITQAMTLMAIVLEVVSVMVTRKSPKPQDNRADSAGGR